MKTRKTMPVVDIVKTVNNMLRESTCTPAERSAMCTVLEEVLHATGNYRGYRYLEANEVPHGHDAGVVRELHGNVFPDESRRQYIS